MHGPSGKRELAAGTAIALVLSVLLSIATVYGLNRYLGPVEDPLVTGALRAAPVD